MLGVLQSMLAGHMIRLDRKPAEVLRDVFRRRERVAFATVDKHANTGLATVQQHRNSDYWGHVPRMSESERLIANVAL